MKSDDDDFEEQKAAHHKYNQKEIESLFIDEDQIIFDENSNSETILISKIPTDLTHKKLCEFI